MKRLLLVPCFAGIAAAMPLHIGGNWVWRMVDRASNATSLRSARVLSSTADDSTTTWVLAVHDSTTDEFQKAEILEWKSTGLQRWKTGSVLLPIEPQAWNRSSNASLPPALEWGQIAMSSMTGLDATSSFKITRRADSLTAEVYKSTQVNGWPVTNTNDAPIGTWSDERGPERFRFGGKDWRLVRFANADLAIPSDAFQLPDSGSVRVWTVVSSSAKWTGTTIPAVTPTTTVSTYRWEIMSPPIDSAGWISMQVLETRKKTGGSPSTFVIPLRLNRLTGQRLPPRRDSLFLPDDSWRTDWAALPLAGGSATLSQSSWSSGLTEWSKTQTSQTTVTRGDELDSLQYSFTATNYMGGSSTGLAVVLQSVDGDYIRDPFLPTSVRPHEPVHLDNATLAAWARREPDARVRWSDARGRSGSTTLEDLASSRSTAGVLHLSMTLRDGATVSGSCLMVR